MKRVIFLSIPDNRIYEEKKWKQFTSSKLPVIHPCGKETGAIAAQWLSRLCSMRGWYVYLYRPKRGEEEKEDYRVKMMNAIRSEMSHSDVIVWIVECRTFIPVSVYDERSELQLHDHDSHSMYIYPSTKETMGMELANRLRNETTEKYSVSIETETTGKTNYKWIHKMGMGHCFTMDFHLDLLMNEKRFFSLCNAISEWIHLASLRFEFTNMHHHKTTQLNKRHQTHVSASSSSSSSYHLFVSSSKGDPFQPPPPIISSPKTKKNKEVSFDIKQKRENTSDGPYERIILNLSSSSKNFLPHSYVSAQAIGESVRWDRTSQLVPVQTYPVEFWTTAEKVNKDTAIRLILSEKKMDTLKTRMVYSEYAHSIIPLSLFYQKAMVVVSMNWVYGVSEEKEKQKIKFQMSLHPDCTLTRRISDRLTVVSTEKKKREEKEKKIIIEKYQKELQHQIETHLTQQSIYSEFPSGRRPTWNRLLHVNQTSFGWMNDFMYFWIQEKSSLPLSVVDTFADHLIRVTCLHLNLTLNEYFTWAYTQEGFVPFFFSQLITLIPGLLSYTSDEFEDNHSFPWSAETKKTSESATDCEEIGSTCTFVIKQLMKAKKSSLMAPMRDFLSHYIPFTCHITAQQDTEKGTSSTKTDILHVIAGMMPRSLYQTLLIKDLPTKAPKESDLELIIESDPLKFPVLLFDAIADAEATYYHYEPPQKRNRAHLETPEEEMRLPSIMRRFYDSRYQMAHKLKYNLLAMYVMDENDIDKCKELIPVIWNYHTESWCWGMPLSLLWCGFRTGVQGIPKPPTPVKFSLLKYTALWEAVTPSNELKQLATEISKDVSVVNRIRFTPDKASSYLTDHSLDETVLLERKTYPNRIRSIYLVYHETDTGISLKKRLERDLKQSNLSLLYKTHIISTSSVYIIDGFDDVSRVLLLYNFDKK